MLQSEHLLLILRAECESKLTEKRMEEMKGVESSILQIKGQIYNLKVGQM